MTRAAFAAPDDRPWLRDPFLWLAVALGLAVRAWPVLAYPRLRIWQDERLHYVMSVVARHVEEQLLGHWPPAYELFLGAIFGAFGPSMVAARWFQVGLSTLTVAMVYGLGRAAGGTRVARIAALLCALYPGLVAYAHLLYSETLFIALLVGAALLLHHRREGPARVDLLGAGVLFGLAALTRSVALYFLPVWLAWLALGRRWPETRRVAIVLGIALLTVAPWTLRNYLAMGDFILIDTTAGRTAWWAYNEVPFCEDVGHPKVTAFMNRDKCEDIVHPRREPLPRLRELEPLFPPRELDSRTAERLVFELFLIRRYATLDLMSYQSCELANARSFVAERPGLAAQRVGQRLGWFWAPTSLFLRSVLWESYRGGLLDVRFYPVVKWGFVAVYVSVVSFALLSLGAGAGTPLREWIVLLCVYATALHSLSLAASRYRLPLMPFVLVLAGTWLAHPGLPGSRARRALVVALWLAFAGVCVVYLANVLP